MVTCVLNVKRIKCASLRLKGKYVCTPGKRNADLGKQWGKMKVITENDKVNAIMALFAEIMHRTELRSNLEKSPGHVIFSDIQRSNCLVFKLDMALALISPIFELIALPVAILQSYYKRWVSSTPIWNHGPFISLSLCLYPRSALLVRQGSKWNSLSNPRPLMESTNSYCISAWITSLFHLCLLVVCTYVSHCREQRGDSDAGNIFRIMILSGISHRLAF